MKRIAFLGIGAMGARMAAHLISDFDVVVWNRTRARANTLVEAGATFAETPRAAADGAEVIITILTDDDAARTVWLDPENGIVAGLAQGAIAIESSTVTPDWIDELNDVLTAKEVVLLDAPVAGSTPQAEAAELAYLIGGPEGAVAEITPILEKMSRVIVHAGETGRGALLKLAVNALFAGQVAIVAELLNTFESHGFSKGDLAGFLSKMPITSPAMVGVMQLMVNEDYAPRFTIDLVEKDLRYATKLGTLPIIEAARNEFEAASKRGFGSENLTAIAKR